MDESNVSEESQKAAENSLTDYKNEILKGDGLQFASAVEPYIDLYNTTILPPMVDAPDIRTRFVVETPVNSPPSQTNYLYWLLLIIIFIGLAYLMIKKSTPPLETPAIRGGYHSLIPDDY